MKDLTKSKQVQELLVTLRHLKESPFLLIAAALIDALFFVAHSFFTTPISDKITEHTVLITNKAAPLIAAGQTGLLKKLVEPEFRPLTGKLILLILLIFLVSYLIYAIFQSASWWMSGRLAGQKWRYHSYALQFARLNLIWFAGYVVFKLLDAFVGLRYVILKQFAPGAPNIAGGILLLLFAIMVVAAVFSYPTLSPSTLFIIPLKTSIPLIAISLIILLNAQFLTNKLAKLFLISSLSTTAYYLHLAWLALLFSSFLILVKTYTVRMLHVHTRD